jgi:hypothetical protein
VELTVSPQVGYGRSPFNARGDLDVDFSTALQVNERQRLATLLAPVLRDLPVDDRDAAFESLRDWLAGHDRVADVEVVPGMLRSDPPIKEFAVRLAGSDPPEYRTIGVRVTRAGYVFDTK